MSSETEKNQIILFKFLHTNFFFVYIYFKIRIELLHLSLICCIQSYCGKSEAIYSAILCNLTSLSLAKSGVETDQGSSLTLSQEFSGDTKITLGLCFFVPYAIWGDHILQ